MSMQALNTQTPQRRSSLLERYQPKTGSQDPMSASLDPPAPPSITKSTSQRSLQHSSLLQRYQPKPLGSAGAGGSSVGVPPNAQPPNRSSSQRSLDQSKLLRRYYHQPHSLDENQPPEAGGQEGARLTAANTDPQRYSSQRSLENSKLLQRYNPTVNNSQEFTGLSVRESTPVARFNRGTSLEPDRIQRSSLLSKYTPRFGKSLDRNQALEAAKGYGGGYGSEQHLPHGPAAQQERPVQSLASSRNEIADYGADHFDYYRDIRSRSSSLSRGGLAGRKGAPSARGSQRRLSGVEPMEPVTPETLPVVSAVTEPVLGNIASALPLPMVSVIPPTPAPVQQQQQQQQQHDVSRSPFDGKTLSVTSSQVGQSAAPVVQPTPPVKPIRKDLQTGGKATETLAAAAAAAPAGGATANIVSIALPTITTVLAAPSVKQSVSSEPPKEPSPPLFSTRDRMDHYGSASNPDPVRSASNQNLHHPQRPTTTMTNTLQLPGISDMSSRRSMTDLRHLPPATTNSTLGTDNLDELTEFTDRAELKKLAAQRHQHPVKHGLANAFEQLAAFTIPQAMDGDETEERIEALPPDRKLKRRDFTYHPTFVPKQNATPSAATLTVPGSSSVDPSLDSRRSTASTVSKQAENEEKRRQAAEEKRKREEERRQRDADKRAHDEQERQRKEEEKRRKEDEKRARDEEDRARKEDERRQKEEEKRLKEDEKRRERDEKKRLKDEKKKTAAAAKASAKATGSSSTVATDPAKPDTAEEEMIDLASHLDHYSVAVTMQTQQLQQQRSTSLGRPRSGGTPYGSQGVLGTSSRGLSNSYQSLDRGGAAGAGSASVNRSQSKLLQRYGPRAGSQEAISTGLSGAGAGTGTGTGTDTGSARELHRSQGSLDFRRSNRPSLLDKYTPRPLSASQQQQQPMVGADPRTTRSTSQRSLDSGRVERSSLLQRYKPTGDAPRRDPYEHRDHEYEPIGEPVPGSRLQPAAAAAAADGQHRKLSNSSFLRVPAGDEGDTVSMEELQKSIEDRFFNQPPADAEAAGTSVPTTEGVEGATTAATDEPKASKMKAAMAKAQSSGKQAMAKAQESGKQAMAKAQEGGKTLQKKLMQQTDRFKTKMSNIKLKKDGKDSSPAPLASPEVVTTPELEKLDFTLAVPKDEEEQQHPDAEIQSATPESPEAAAEEEHEGATTDAGKSGGKFAKLKNIHMPKLQKPDFKRPDFSKISKPKMPKLRGPDMSKFKRPEMPKFLTEKPDFGKMSEKIKLSRSKSMKEPSPSAATSAASPSDVSALGPVDDAPGRPSTKINYTDFSTYPRLFDKFKRQKSAPSGQASVRAGTPPPLEFTKAAKTTRAQGPNVVSRWTSEKSSEDAGGSNRFLQYTGSELDERETSVERRMRQELERAEFEGPELLAVTEEQKQLEEYDKENREIHLLSAARHDEFMKRKPPMERQESDLASEEEKQFWASALGQKIRQNIDMNSNDLDLLDEEERLLVAKENDEIDQEVREQAQYLLELSRQRAEKEHERRSSTPYTNQECQSSGSSSVRRRKGVLEEIDDDEFFLRQKGISKDNIQMGEYISSAIKEGLSHPKNALADMDRYDYYDEDTDGLRRYYQPSFESDDVSNRQDFTDSYRTFPPDRPNRKGKSKGAQAAGTTGYDEENDLDRIETEEQDDELAYYDRQRRTKYGSEQPELLQSVAARYMDDEFEDDGSLRRGEMLAGSVVPPTPPSRRRKKRFRDVTPSDVDSFANGAATTGAIVGKSISNNFIAGSLPTQNVTVNRAEVPLAREESFGTIPEPAPRRSRSRSQLGSKILLADEDMDRVSRGAESLIGGIIDAAPGARGSYPYEVSENNGYATVRKEAPPRPPAPIRRRKSTRSLDAAPPVRQFNTLPSSYNHSVSPVRPQRNYSTINPNRPPRRKSVTSLTGSQQQLKPTTQRSRDDGGQYEDVLEGPVPPQRPPPPVIQRDVANKMKDRPLPPPPRPTRKPRRPDGTDRHDLDGGAERVVSVDVEEIDTSTQTDPVSEDFGLDAEIAAVTEQAAAASSRVNDAEQLEGALHRFRDGNVKALSDRPKSSRSGSRPETPASILIERKVSTPSLAHESVVEASLTVQPLEEFDDDQYIAELVKKYVSEEARKPEPRRTVDERRLRKSTSSLGREEEIRPVETLGTSLRTPTIRSTSRTSVDGRLSAATPEPLRNVEISPTVIEEIVERLRTTEQHHIDELHKLHQEQLEDLRKQHEEQKRLQEQRLEEQQRQLLEQQSQQLHETQQLKEQILQQQEHQKLLLAQQQNQQQQLLVAQQQQQLLMEQQEKERELQREKERELLREREQELERARERERELHLARELELQRAREVEQQRARDLEQQRIREMEVQRAREQEHQRLRELEIQRAIEAEQGRQRELELQQRAAQAAAAAQSVAKETATAAPTNETPSDAPLQPTVEEQPAAEGSVDVVDGPTIATTTELSAAATGAASAPPVRPPLPPLPPYAFHPDYLAYGIPPAAASQYLLRPSSLPSEEDGMTPLAPQRRRRHLRSKRESTSEDDQLHQQQREQQQRRHRHSTRSPEPSIPSLGGQLVRACGSSLRQTGDDLMAMLRASSKDENKRDLHIAIIILIVIVAGLMALGMSGEKAVHHHHWDYFSPPGHGGA
ncbi:uncharacterized protein LOC126578923 isoform X2 [Anopheles aquasalis]|uniref:uncharacterized protein LOC126578923 isoform X2 n=1 Tax=Anopheles aquasalis TaxID=42839 RepID=UPI00215ACFA4|nr:uncharacterized protein LOC126578923 isoform X2 [Anopheles aquasalis]